MSDPNQFDPLPPVGEEHDVVNSSEKAGSPSSLSIPDVSPIAPPSITRSTYSLMDLQRKEDDYYLEPNRVLTTSEIASALKPIPSWRASRATIGRAHIAVVQFVRPSTTYDPELDLSAAVIDPPVEPRLAVGFDAKGKKVVDTLRVFSSKATTESVLTVYALERRIRRLRHIQGPVAVINEMSNQERIIAEKLWISIGNIAANQHLSSNTIEKRLEQAAWRMKLVGIPDIAMATTMAGTLEADVPEERTDRLDDDERSMLVDHFDDTIETIMSEMKLPRYKVTDTWKSIGKKLEVNPKNARLQAIIMATVDGLLSPRIRK